MRHTHRVLALILFAVIVLSFCACGETSKSGADVTVTAIATPTPTEAPTPSPNLTPTPEPKIIVVEPTQPDASDVSRSVPAARDYVLNTNSMKFHDPSCSSVGKIKPENRKDVTMTREEVVAMGYDPCGNCKP